MKHQYHAEMGIDLILVPIIIRNVLRATLVLSTIPWK